MNSSGGQPSSDETDPWFPLFMFACGVIVFLAWIVLEPREESRPEPVHASARP